MRPALERTERRKEQARPTGKRGGAGRGKRSELLFFRRALERDNGLHVCSPALEARSQAAGTTRSGMGKRADVWERPVALLLLPVTSSLSSLALLLSPSSPSSACTLLDTVQCVRSHTRCMPALVDVARLQRVCGTNGGVFPSTSPSPISPVLLLSTRPVPLLSAVSRRASSLSTRYARYSTRTAQLYTNLHTRNRAGFTKTPPIAPPTPVQSSPVCPLVVLIRVATYLDACGMPFRRLVCFPSSSSFLAPTRKHRNDSQPKRCSLLSLSLRLCVISSLFLSLYVNSCMWSLSSLPDAALYSLSFRANALGSSDVMRGSKQMACLPSSSSFSS